LCRVGQQQPLPIFRRARARHFERRAETFLQSLAFVDPPGGLQQRPLAPGAPNNAGQHDGAARRQGRAHDHLGKRQKLVGRKRDKDDEAAEEQAAAESVQGALQTPASRRSGESHLD
jgi:hypothetical protein